MNLLTSSLSTSFSVSSSPSWAHGGMVTDATISDVTDKGDENVAEPIYFLSRNSFGDTLINSLNLRLKWGRVLKPQR